MASSMLSQYRIMYGDFEMMEFSLLEESVFENKTEQVMSIILFVLFVFTVGIVMLNLLIAVVTSR